MTDTAARYLVVIQLEKGGSDRLAEDVPVLMEWLRRLSGGEQEIAFRSTDGTLFGVLLKTATPPRVIRSQFEGSEASRGNDAILILPIGDGFTGSGFSRAWTWLQHH